MLLCACWCCIVHVSYYSDEQKGAEKGSAGIVW